MNPKQEDLNFKVDDDAGPVKCLGMTFENDVARREHFTCILREQLKDPEFRKIEGFPIGSDEDILALSDPPYYTACPNPFIADFVKQYGKPYDPKKPYSREPFAADVSEGKNDPIYNAHSYHTKVPHKAIMRYILHYTEPGDIVFDGFCGTGMTGVAAQTCGDRAVVESLGYRVDREGTILRQETNENGKTIWKPFSKLGSRRAVLNDLSPAATFIAYNYNTPVDVVAFEREAKRILKEVEDECGWMYETLHTDGKTKGKINYTVWSDVFICPECTREVIFWEAAVNKKAGSVQDQFPCPHCGVMLTKRRMDHAWVSKYDSSIKQTIRQAKQVPVLINYTVGGKRAEKVPDNGDLALIAELDNSDIPYWFPTDRMMEGGETRRNDPIGITHVHHFYTKRNLWVLAAVLDRTVKSTNARLLIWLTASMIRTTKMYKFTLDRKMGTVSGTLFIPSLWTENGAFKLLNYKVGDMKKAGSASAYCPTSCASFERIDLLDEGVDYIFIDPPFGANLNYSELNFLWESWLKVWTNNKPEAIENKIQGKGLNEYRHLMTACFREAYRVLKPGRWMTVEFSNTKASVWNSIQTALMEAGFIVANVSALDKQQGSFKAVNTPTAVKQDLVISAYKPNGGLEKRFAKIAETEEGVWAFISTHLKNLPVLKQRGGELEFISERDPRILYDRTVAYYIQHTLPVPLSSAEFQSKLAEKFPERDGMYFLPEQASKYDEKRIHIQGLGQMSIWVEDERSAVDWLRNYLKDKPSKYQDVMPEFFEQLNQSWKKWEIKPELRGLLDQNFLCYDGKGDVPPQIHAYLSTNFKEFRKLAADDPALRAKANDRWYVPDPRKNADVEMMRDKRLLEEFWTYLPPGYQAASAKRGDSGGQQMIPGFEQPQPKLPRGKKLKLVRTEAVRVGFKHCYQNKDYPTIIAVANHIPDDVVNGDDQLQMIYDTAVTRSGGDL